MKPVTSETPDIPGCDRRHRGRENACSAKGSGAHFPVSARAFGGPGAVPGDPGLPAAAFAGSIEPQPATDCRFLGSPVATMTERAKPSPTGTETTLDAAQREALLRRSFIFKDLPQDLLAGLARITTTRRIPHGQTLFQQGDEGDALYAVITGLIRISVVGRAGKALTLALLEPGDLFGEIALLDGLSRTAAAEAAADCMLLVIERATFLDLLQRDGRLARHIIELLCDRLRENTDRLSEFAFLDLNARLAGQLQSLSIAHGRDTDDGVRIDIKLSQTDLAEMLGVSREAVNKQLKSWSAIGLLRVDRGFITVLDRHRLAAMAQAESGETHASVAKSAGMAKDAGMAKSAGAMADKTGRKLPGAMAPSNGKPAARR